LYDLVAIGNPVYDEIITPYIQSKGRILSGCSTNACLAAKKLGLGKVALIGCIGRAYEKRYKHELSGYGIELPLTKISDETGGFKLVYDHKGNRTLDVLGVADKIFPEDFPSECLDSKVLLLGPILQEIDLKFVKFLKQNSDAKIFLDPQGMIRKIGPNGRIQHKCDRNTIRNLVKLVDYIKPNETEAITLTGKDDPYLSSKLLVEWGSSVGIVTLAERGSLLYDSKNYYRIPAYKTLAKDPTGAGDTYAGSFICGLLAGKNIHNSALFASAAASIKIEYSGPDFPLTSSAVNTRVRELDHFL
jgi:sugar/nucleoside kinase (ribokinase family)